MTRMVGRALGAIVLLVVSLAAAPARAATDAELILDVNWLTLGAGSAPTSPVSAAGTTFFVANDGSSGAELWKTDGTSAGTLRVKDINPGPGGSAPALLTRHGSLLYFRADDGVHGPAL